MHATAISGETQLMMAEGVGRALSLSMDRLHLGNCGRMRFRRAVAKLAAHPGADLLDRGFRGLDGRRKASACEHRNSVADAEELVELLGDHEQPHALVAQVDQRLADELRRTDVDAPGRLRYDHHFRL